MPVVTFCGTYNSTYSHNDWVNPSNVQAADGAYASVVAPYNDYTVWLAVKFSSCDIPTDAVINSVKMQALFKYSAYGTNQRFTVSGGYQGTSWYSAGSNSSAPTSDTTVEYTYTDETANTYTVAMLNSGNVYARVQTRNTNSTYTGTTYVDYIRMVVDYTTSVAYTKTLTAGVSSSTATGKGAAKTITAGIKSVASILAEIPGVKYVKTIIANVTSHSITGKGVAKTLETAVNTVANTCKTVTKYIATTVSVTGLMDKLRPGTEHVKTIIANVSSGASLSRQFGYVKTITANIVANVTTNKAIAVVKTVFAALKAKFSIPARAIKGASAGLQTRTVNLDTHERITKLTNKSRRVDIEVIKW